MALRKSMTYVEDPAFRFKGGSLISCECGKKTLVIALHEFRQVDTNGFAISSSYCCPRCFSHTGDLVVLLDDIYKPRIDFVDQTHGWKPPRREL